MVKMSHMYGNGVIMRRSLFQKGIYSFLMQVGLEEIL